MCVCVCVCVCVGVLKLPVNKVHEVIIMCRQRYVTAELHKRIHANLQHFINKRLIIYLCYDTGKEQ